MDPNRCETLHPRLLIEATRRDFAEHPGSTIRTIELNRDSGAHRSNTDTKRPELGRLESEIELHETIGIGGMGVVVNATQLSLGRQVAVKTLPNDATEDALVTLMLREAWVTGALAHPNIVPIYDLKTTTAGGPAIVMKRIEGTSWADLISCPDMIREKFDEVDPVEWNIAVLTAVCHAVEFAHTKSIIHRDIKPANVMVGQHGEVYLLDWGLALSTKADPSGRLAVVGQHTDFAGTPAYMAPEMADVSLGELTPQVDVYQLGAILFTIFAGVPPHRGTNFTELMRSVLAAKPVFPETFPLEPMEICSRAMDREPRLRYDGVHAFRLAVADYLRHRESCRLESSADVSYTLLVKALATSPSDAREIAIARALGECRFGFRAALVAWPGNESARLGLDRALFCAIEHELAEGRAHSASALVDDMSSPPEELIQRINAHPRTYSDFILRVRELEGDVDPSIGRAARHARIAAFAFFWGSGSLLAAAAGHGAFLTPATLTGASLVSFVFGVGLLWWRAEALITTDLNRKTRVTFLGAMVLQCFVALGCLIGGGTAHHCVLAWTLLWCVVEGVMAIWVDGLFLLSAVLLGCAAAIGLRWPGLLLYAVAFANLGIGLTAWLARRARGSL